MDLGAGARDDDLPNAGVAAPPYIPQPRRRVSLVALVVEAPHELARVGPEPAVVALGLAEPVRALGARRARVGEDACAAVERSTPPPRRRSRPAASGAPGGPSSERKRSASSINSTGADFAQMDKLVEFLPALSELHMANNRISTTGDRSTPGGTCWDRWPSLTLLDLSDNSLNSWEQVVLLNAFGKLETLLLPGNNLPDITFGDKTAGSIFARLRVLSLANNKIQSLASLHALRTLAVSEVRMQGNPVCEGIGTSAFRQLVIAMVPSLVSLNGGEVRGRERTEAEKFYIGYWLRQTEAPDADTLRKHDTVFASLGEKHGLPAVRGQGGGGAGPGRHARRTAPAISSSGPRSCATSSPPGPSRTVQVQRRPPAQHEARDAAAPAAPPPKARSTMRWEWPRSSVRVADPRARTRILPPLIAYARKPSQAASWDDADSAGGFSSLWYSVTGVHLGARKASPAGAAYASMVSTVGVPLTGDNRTGDN